MTPVSNRYTAVVVQLARLGDLAQTWLLIDRLKKRNGPNATALVVDRRLREITELMVGKNNVLPLPINGYLRHTATETLLKVWREVVDLKQTLASSAARTAINLNYHPAIAALAEAIPASCHLGARWKDIKTDQPSDHQIRELFNATSGLRRGTKHLSDIWAEYAENGVYANPLQPLKLPEGVIESGRRTIRDAGIKSRDAPIALIVGSGLNARSLPVSHQSLLTAELSSEAPVILVGSRQEAQLANDIIHASSGNPERVVSLCGRTNDSAVLAGVLSCCRLTIGVDTGPLHIAAMVGTDCLGIYYGSMNFRETGPYGSGHVVITPDDPDYPCHEREMEINPQKYIDAIPPDNIIRIAQDMLHGDSISLLAGVGVNVFSSSLGVEGLIWEDVHLLHNPVGVSP